MADAERCPTCDRAECCVAYLRAKWQMIRNGTDVDALQAAVAELDEAWFDCNAQRVNWRARAIAAEATVERQARELGEARGALTRIQLLSRRRTRGVDSTLRLDMELIHSEAGIALAGGPAAARAALAGVKGESDGK